MQVGGVRKLPTPIHVGGRGIRPRCALAVVGTLMRERHQGTSTEGEGAAPTDNGTGPIQSSVVRYQLTEN